MDESQQPENDSNCALDGPLDLSSKNDAKNSIAKKSASSPNKPATASCTNIEKSAMNDSCPETITESAKVKSETINVLKNHLRRRIEQSESKQMTFAPTQFVSQVNDRKTVISHTSYNESQTAIPKDQIDDTDVVNSQTGKQIDADGHEKESEVYD